MRKILLLAVVLLTTACVHAQLLTWTPEFPQDNSTLVITVDASKGNQGLFNYANPNNVYVHTGVTTNLSNNGGQQWLYVNGSTGGSWGSTTPALKAVSLGNNKYQYTITNIRSFFGVPAGETIRKVGILFRDANADPGQVKKQSNSDGSDMFIPVYNALDTAIRFKQPFFEPRFVPWLEPINLSIGQQVPTTFVSAPAGDLKLFFNNTQIATANAANTLSASPTIAVGGNQVIRAEYLNNGTFRKDSVQFFVTVTPPTAPLPPNVREGINYDANNTSVTLVLYAPQKNDVIVIGDFNSWVPQLSYQMNKTPDGKYFWKTITGLTPGQEYGYQYLIDNSIRVADPYTQKILDPGPFADVQIDNATYPNLKPYPTGLTTEIVSVLQTAEPQYNWQVNNFVKPAKTELLIYETLVRDLVAAHNWQTLIDTIAYIKRLNINAIELMPFNEFENNDSWGYNPSFYFAPDKFYGTKNKLKEFIDTCHRNGIAVIMDIVFNHEFGQGPHARMYWNSATNQPAANNPWLNATAAHPFNVGYDFNHESPDTKYLMQRSLEHWINEYRIDGFRFDLSKGFTQRVTTDVNAWSAYDASRIAIWKRYADSIWKKSPSTYMILEHFAVQQEDKELADYGFLLWGNENYQYNQNTMGYATDADFSPVLYNHPSRNFNQPNLVGYMESHDEERLMYKNITFGNSAGGYNTKDIPTALKRMEAANALFLTIPGPKMIYEMGELGYDLSINTCTDGTLPPNGDCRTARKPFRWNYLQDPNRRNLYDMIGKVLGLRKANPALFSSSNYTANFSTLVKSFQISGPGRSATIIANFDVTAQNASVTFQNAGTWTDFLTNATITATGNAQTISLQPGEYHIYLNQATCATAAPVAPTPIAYCQGVTATALTATGTNLLWYTTPTGGTGNSTAPVPLTNTAGSTTYYVSQTIGCESARFPVVVNVTATIGAPTVTGTVNYCRNTTAVALTATGTNLLWYTTATGGVGNAAAPVPSTGTAGTTTYYVSQSNSCGEGPRAAINVVIAATPAAPAGLNTTAITTTSAVLNWAVVAGNYYAVEYKAATATNWISLSGGITTGPQNLAGLNANTVYDWRVSSNCAPAATNNYSTAQFTTASVATGTNIITNIRNGLGLKVSPNPAQDEARVDFILPGNGSFSLVLLNAQGQKIHTLLTNNLQTRGRYQVSISRYIRGLARGIYFIRLEQDGNENFVKFVKQ
jgi:glycosidase